MTTEPGLRRITAYYGGKRDSIASRTKSAFSKPSQTSDHSALVRVHSFLSPEDSDKGFDCRFSYAISGDGQIAMDATIIADPSLPNLPRVGVEMAMLEGYENVTWFGRGPHENYIDRKSGAACGLL